MKIPTEVRLCWDFFRGCTCLKCTNRARTAPTELTIRGYVGVRGYGRDAIPSYNCSP